MPTTESNAPKCYEQNLTPAQQSLHKNFVSSVRALRRDLVRAGYYLLQVREQRIHRFLGYSRIQDYAESVAGLTTRQCQDLLTMARRLPEFEEVEAALREGSLGWSQARLIVSRTHPQDQLQWLGLARGESVKSLEMEIRENARTDPAEAGLERDADDEGEESAARAAAATAAPNLRQSEPAQVSTRSAPDAALEPRELAHHITLKLTGLQYALWQRLTEQRRGGEDLADRVLTALAGGPEGAHVLETVLVLLECPSCTKATTATSRGEVPIPLPLLEAFRCDAILEDENACRRRAIPPRMRRRALRRARYRCENPGCGQAVFLQVHHRRPVAGGGGEGEQNLIVLCWRCHRDLHARDLVARTALRDAPNDPRPGPPIKG